MERILSGMKSRKALVISALLAFTLAAPPAWAEDGPPEGVTPESVRKGPPEGMRRKPPEGTRRGQRGPSPGAMRGLLMVHHQTVSIIMDTEKMTIGILRTISNEPTEAQKKRLFSLKNRIEGSTKRHKGAAKSKGTKSGHQTSPEFLYHENIQDILHILKETIDITENLNKSTNRIQRKTLSGMITRIDSMLENHRAMATSMKRGSASNLIQHNNIGKIMEVLKDTMEIVRGFSLEPTPEDDIELLKMTTRLNTMIKRHRETGRKLMR